MANIRLQNNSEYDIAVNGWLKTSDILTITVASDEITLSDFEGNDTVYLTDGVNEYSAEGYTNLIGVETETDYAVGGVDENGNDIKHDVYIVRLATDAYVESMDEDDSDAETFTPPEDPHADELSVSLEERINDLEMAVCELYDSIAEA